MACAEGTSELVRGPYAEVNPNQPDGPDGAAPIAPEPPHALGRISLGESHDASLPSQSSGSVSVVFVPDANLAKTCASKLNAECELRKVPSCSSSCDSGEYCVFDDACNAVCKKLPVCEKRCGRNETCVADKSGKGICKVQENFDAGPLAFGGTTMALTLYPPYAWSGSSSGAPFLAGAELKVQAQGAIEAGFEAFEESFRSTSFLQTKPALSEISASNVFSDEDIPLSWLPGTDRIVVTVTGAAGVATCTTEDASGSYALSRKVIDAVKKGSSAGSTLGLSVERQRVEVRKGKKVEGTLESATVQPDGWLELVTGSKEVTSFYDCGAGRAACLGGSSCYDLSTSVEHCGVCGNACATGKVCSGGVCRAQ